MVTATRKWHRLLLGGGALVALVLLAVILGTVRGSAPSAEADVTGSEHLYIDTIPPFCDNASNHQPNNKVLNGQTYQVGICVQDQMAAPTAFTAFLDFNEAITSAPEVADAAPALNDNPDANDGDAPGGDKLGSGWDCTGLGLQFPKGNDGGVSKIACNGTPIGGEDADLTDSPGLLATVTYTATSAGSNTIVWDNAASGTNTLTCTDTDCLDAKVTHNAAADIQLVKDVNGQGPIGVGIAGGPSKFTLVVTNKGPDPAANVNVFDDLKDEFTVKGEPTVNGQPGACTVTDIDTDMDTVPDFLNVVQCALGDMPPGSVNVINIVVNIPVKLAGQTIVNAALAGSGTLPGIINQTPDPDFTPVKNIANALGESPATFCASDRYNGTIFDDGSFVDINPLDECDNVALAILQVSPAGVKISKSGAPNPVNAGAQATWTVTVTNNQTVNVPGFGTLPSSPASNLIITDTIDANQEIKSATISAGTCAETGTDQAQVSGAGKGNSATCSSDQTIAPGGSIQLVVTANVTNSPPDTTCSNSANVLYTNVSAKDDPDTQADESVTQAKAGPANASITCLPPTVRMNKDADPSTIDLDNELNLWICNATVGCNKNGEGQLQVHELLFNANDPDGVGAYEFVVKYDHKIFDIAIIDTNVLYKKPSDKPEAGDPCDPEGDTTPNGICNERDQGGVGCSVTIINENSIRYGCVSKKNGGEDRGLLGPGPFSIAILNITPEADLKKVLTPGQENGIKSHILDNNCEAADIFGDPLQTSSGTLLPGVLPGGLIADCSDLLITVRMLEGDLDLDCDVDVEDDQAIAFRYGSAFGSLRYNEFYDLEPALKDGDIDIKDLQKVFGRNNSTCNNPIPPQPPVSQG